MREERVAVQEADKEEEEVEADEDAVEMTESVSREYTIYTLYRGKGSGTVQIRDCGTMDCKSSFSFHQPYVVQT